MRVPISWMASYSDPGWEPAELGGRLAMTGTEVERIDTVGAPDPDGYVVGHVLEVSKHPDADRLSVCVVDTGDGESRTIVCGAPNVAAGQTVAVALPGACMPDGEKLRKAKLRGVVSDGMILSERELEIGEEHDGIMVLEGKAKPGAPLGELLEFRDSVLELEVTPNRPDCFGVFGVAREAHAISDADLSDPPWEPDAKANGEGDVSGHASVEVNCPDLCPRFTARVFTDVEVGFSPLWLKARLLAAGQRPINNVVDITNYVMLATGQPLHAYDLAKVGGAKLIVEEAKGGEKLVTIDGEERKLEAGEMVINDAEGPNGLAGIMGGQGSEVSEATTTVLMESANWHGTTVLRTSNRLALRSEASSRFEKQLHPELAMRGQQMASRLMLELCGKAKLVPGTIDVTGEIPEPHVMELDAGRVEALLGMRIEPEECERSMGRLGFGVKRKGEVLTVTVPPERHYDVSREADLIEEVGRVHYLDETLPTTLPAGGNRSGGLDRHQTLRRAAEDAMRGLGADEIVAWSFHDPGLPDRLLLGADDARRKAIEIGNPLSVDQSVMRTVLIAGLLDAARLNLSRRTERVSLFESGRVYLNGTAQAGSGALGGEFSGDQAPPAQEPHRLGLLLCGPPAPAWRDPAPEPDLFVAKGMLEALGAALKAPVEVIATESPEPFLHPGRAAAVEVDGTAAGWIGELHPLVCRAWDLPSATAFEIDLAPLLAAAKAGEEIYDDLTTYPAAHQDIAVVVSEDVPAAKVRAAVLEGGGELLRSAEVFDRFSGDQVGAGMVSLALRLEFRALDRTLTDEEVGKQRAQIATALTEIGGTLRE